MKLFLAYHENGLIKTRTELERRDRYMSMITEQLYNEHPLIKMIEMCLDIPQERPNICEVLHQLCQAKAEVDEYGSEMDKHDLMQDLHGKSQTLVNDTFYTKSMVCKMCCLHQNPQMYSHLQKIQKKVRNIETVIKD